MNNIKSIINHLLLTSCLCFSCAFLQAQNDTIITKTNEIILCKIVRIGELKVHYSVEEEKGSIPISKIKRLGFDGVKNSFYNAPNHYINDSAEVGAKLKEFGKVCVENENEFSSKKILKKLNCQKRIDHWGFAEFCEGLNVIELKPILKDYEDLQNRRSLVTFGGIILMAGGIGVSAGALVSEGRCQLDHLFSSCPEQKIRNYRALETIGLVGAVAGASFMITTTLNIRKEKKRLIEKELVPKFNGLAY